MTCLHRSLRIYQVMVENQEKEKYGHKTEQCGHEIHSQSNANMQRDEGSFTGAKIPISLSDRLAHLVMDYLEKKMKTNATMARVEFNNEQKKIRTENNDDPKFCFEQTNAAKMKHQLYQKRHKRSMRQC